MLFYRNLLASGRVRVELKENVPGVETHFRQVEREQFTREVKRGGGEGGVGKGR